MTAQKHDPTLIDAIQGEVSNEASPLLEFLFRHSKLIILFFVLFLLAIVGYWVYSGHQAKGRLAAMNDLGKILINPQIEERYTDLEAYVKNAPAAVESESLFALATTAQQAGKYAVAFDTWNKIGTKYPEIGVQAAFGKVKSLMGQNKREEALKVLDALLPSLKPGTAEAISVNNLILSIAEVMGNYDRAVSACEVIVLSGNTSEGSMFWQQKLVELKQKAEAKKANKS